MSVSAVAVTPEIRQRLDTEGFWIFEDVFTSAEMGDVIARIEAFQRRHEASLRERGGAEGISRADEITFTSHLAEADDALRAFCQRPEFVALTTQLLGPDTDLYWNQAVFKHPDGTQQFPWHQDDGYTPVEPSPYVTLWLALSDATVENGCVWVLPGSHRRGLLPHVPTPIGLSCHPLDHPDQGIPAPVRAGSLVCFWSKMVHKSGVNVSDGVRKAYVIQYSHAGLKNALTGEALTGKIPVARGGRAVS